MSNVIQFKIIPKQQNQKSILLKSKMWESLTLPDLVFFLTLHILPNIYV